MLNMNTTKNEKTNDITLSRSIFGSSLIPVSASPLDGIKYDFEIAEIGHSEDFQQLLQVLRYANPEDEIHLHINSGGGSLFTAVQICSAIAETAAKSVTGHAEGLVVSAATLIFLSCNRWKVSPLSSFMFHTSSSVEMGKMPDMLKSIEAHKAHLNVVARTIYRDFLTEDEIHNIINENHDLWMTVDEVNERLQILVDMEKERARIAIASEAAEALGEEEFLDIEIPEVTDKMTKKQLIEAYEKLANEIISFSELNEEDTE